MIGQAVANARTRVPPPQTGFATQVSELLDVIDVRLMESDAEREAVARLRYDSYRREGAIAPNSSGTFADPYDDNANCWILGLYIGDELASSVRIHVATRFSPAFPSLSVFRDLLEPDLHAGATIVDPTRFVTDARLSRLYTGLPHVTVRLCWMAAEHFGATHLLAAVRAEHQAFYKRLFGHRMLCGPRNYPLLTKPITLMTVDYREVMERVHRRYPFLRSTFFERRVLFERSALTPPNLHEPYVGRSRPIETITAQAS